MSKRGASEYITKENGSIPSATGTEQKPSMASAAQMSGRKMATPRGRLNRAGTPQRRFPPQANSTGTNPFSSIPQQTFGAVGNGLVFGGSQDNNTSPQTGGFTFSANPTSGTNPFATTANPFVTTANPFASINGAPTGSGQIQNNISSQEDDSMDFGSPDKKRNRSDGGTFGASQNTSQSQNANPFGGLFGASAPASQSQTAVPAPNFFATSQPQSQTSASNIFGAPQSQTTAPTPNLFGASQSQTPAKTSNMFAKSQSESAAPTSNPFAGLSATSTTASSSQPPAVTSNLFGKSQSQSQTPTPTSNIFGAPQSQTTSATNNLGGAFDASTAASASQAPAPVPNLFGMPQTQTQTPSTSNIFGKPEPETQSTPAANPFGSLFGASSSAASSQAPASTSNIFGGLSASAPTPQPQFKFGQTMSQASTEKEPASSSNLFGSKHTTTEAAPDKQPEPTFTFGQTAKSVEQAAPVQEPASSKYVFGQTIKPTAQASPEQKPANALSMFSQTPKPAEQAASTQQPASTSYVFGQTTKSTAQESPEKQSATAFNMFGQTPKPADKAAPEQQPANTFNMFGQTAKPTAHASPEKQSATAFNMFGQTSKPAEQAASGAPKPAFTFPAAKKPTPPSTNKDVPIERPIYTKSPSRMPKFLNAEGFMEYDKNYRLRALNKQFQTKLATIDAEQFDFDNIIRHYVAARAAIGGDMGLYQRTIAGSKRKTGEVEEEDIPPQYKKPKLSGSEASQSQSSKRGYSETTTTTAPVAHPANNPFSGISASAVETSNTFKPTSSFGVNTMNAGATPAVKKTTIFGQFSGSTTPVKSPPKKSLFGTLSKEPIISKKRKTSSDDEVDEANPEDEAPTKRSKFSLDMPSTDSSDVVKRKSTSDDEEDEVSSEDETRKKRSKTSNGTPRNIFGASSPKSLSKTPSTVKKVGPFISDDEEETDDQTPDDAEDGDFAPNADGSDDDDSEEEESQQVTDEDNVQTAREDSETSDAPEEDHTEEISKNPNAGRSLFDRVESPASKPQSTSAAPKNQPGSSGINWKAASGLTPPTPTFSPITPGTQSTYKPATTFNYTPTPTTKPLLFAGASVLAGGATNGQEAKFDGMFGSRPGTPDPEKTASKTVAPTSTPADNTWKKGQDIKFNLTEASPDKAANASFGTNSVGFAFGKPAAAPGFLSATPHLGLESGLSSGFSSRATSPGATDNESVATNDTNGDDAGQTDAQQDLMSANPGEENDDLLHVVKAKALLLAKGERAKQLKMAENEWKSIGVGQLRLLKNKETGRVRALLRSNPGANIVLNNYLEPEVDYVVRDQAETQKSGAVFGAFVRDGFMDTIVLKVKDGETAKALAEVMTKHRGDHL